MPVSHFNRIVAKRSVFSYRKSLVLPECSQNNEIRCVSQRLKSKLRFAYICSKQKFKQNSFESLYKLFFMTCANNFPLYESIYFVKHKLVAYRSFLENHLPITDLVMQPIPAHEFGKNISIKWSVSEGTYLIVEALYNTIPCCNSSVGHVKQGTCICAISDPDLYDPDGVVEITVIARNLVSSPNTTLEVEVLKKIQNVSITMHSDFGIGPEGNIFPAEYAVKFDAAYLDGTPTSSQWTINCTESGTSFESALTFEKIWTTTAQDCDILVALRNSISQATARSSVVLKESVILNSLTSNSPMKLNRSMTFVISLQKLGTQTCLWLDLGDNSSLVVFGYHSCPSTINVDQINPNIVIEPRLKFTHKYPDSQEIVIDHVYPRVGSYDVRLYASNDVSMVTEQLVVEVLALECRNPNVSILGMWRHLFYDSLNVSRKLRFCLGFILQLEIVVGVP